MKDITVAELFAGVGGFRIGLEKASVRFRTIWANQWEPGKKMQHAFDCYDFHFGPSLTNSNEDIAIAKKNCPKINLLVGGFPCLPGNTLIQTKQGLVRLDKIETGDMVLSHDGSFQPVSAVFDQGIKDTYKISGYAFDELYATGNHRFYIRKRYFSFENRQRNKHFTDPSWVSVDEFLQENPKDIYFGNKINENEILPEWNGVQYHKNATTIGIKKDLDMSDTTLWYIVGRYLGDGWLRKQQKDGTNRHRYNGIVICCGKDKTEYFEEKIKDWLKYTVATDRTADKYIFSNIELAAFLEPFGTGAENKQIPGFVFDMPVTQLKSLIEGYLDSDGCIINNHLQFTTVSKSLAYGISSILEKLYKKPCQIYMTRTEPFKNIEGRTVYQRDSYTVRCILNNIHISAFYEDGYIWYPLHKITKSEPMHVYDIQVENTHSFIANRSITHNCQDYSVAHSGNAKGIEGKKGVLWWYINDIIRERKPEYVLLENVDRLLKSPGKQRGRDFGVILRCLYDRGYYAEWRVINAAEYGYPQRRRRTFIFAARKTTRWYANIIRTANRSVRDIIYKTGYFADQYKVRRNDTVHEFDLKIRPDEQKYIDLVDFSDNFKAEFENTGFMLNGRVYTATTTPYPHKQKTLADIVESDGVDDKYFLVDNLSKWQYMKGAKKIERIADNGHPYTFSEGPIAFPDPLDKPSRTMLTSESSTNRSTHIIEDPKTGRYRFLTPVECERLNGFPDNWTDTGMPEKFRYFCMGNALVVPLITRMGKQLIKIIDSQQNQ